MTTNRELWHSISRNYPDMARVRDLTAPDLPFEITRRPAVGGQANDRRGLTSGLDGDRFNVGVVRPELEDAADDLPEYALRPQAVRLPSGALVTVYPISALASAMNRSAQTVRRWEREGQVPPAPLRLSRAGTRGSTRAYRLDHLRTAHRLAVNEGIYDDKGLAPKDTNFTTLIFGIWDRLG